MNALGQPIGFAVKNFSIPLHPGFNRLSGDDVSLDPISASHLPDLFEAFAMDLNGGNWTYLAYGPFADLLEFTEWAKKFCFGEDPKFYTVLLKGKPAGMLSFLRIDPTVGSIEIGHVHFSPLLQRTREGTEALLLMINWAFEAGYRRVEWKCDALNAPSRRAAKRLGFSFEGIFKQATIYKSRNRDTAWFSITSQEWPQLEKAYHLWIKRENFDSNGKELKKLSDLTSTFVSRGNTDKNVAKSIAQDYMERTWNRKDLMAIHEYLDDSIIIHSLLGDFSGIQAMKEIVQVWLKGFPDLRVNHENILADNDLVSIQWNASGTHLGEFKEKKPTQKRVFYRGSTVFRIISGKIVEYWAYVDMQHLFNQMEASHFIAECQLDGIKLNL